MKPGDHMKCYMIHLSLLCIFCSTIALSEPIGKIVQLVNDVDISSLTTGKLLVPQIGFQISTDHKIRTGKRSYAEIVLNNGTKIILKEVSVLNVMSLKAHESLQPTRIRLLTGKVRIALKRLLRGGSEHSLILKTPTAVAGVRGTDFGVIASRYETKVAVFSGLVEVASSNKKIIKSYILQEREETGILKNSPPSRPRTVPHDIIKNWFDYYEINDDNRIIIKQFTEESIIDKLLRKQNY